jgi:hypothetical protein
LKAFIECLAVGDWLSDKMPLFITPDAHVPVPLEATYMTTWQHTTPPVRKDLE